ncbi:MAG TPA: PDDEXK nuclease domain-containing protein [Chthonomonadaceae bacterium]|nr:PDDEXK nuclease domain-containing protein [Chthonomonadaceae bacterium]
MSARHKAKSGALALSASDYAAFVSSIAALLENARRQVAQSLNAILTATYWEIGRRIVEFEQGGSHKAEYGDQVIDRLAKDLKPRFGRGFGRRNLFLMRSFYLAYPGIVQTPSAQSDPKALASIFPLSWSHYVKLLSVRDPEARQFYESEALRGGWSLRQLSRQINSLYYERTALSRSKAAMRVQGAQARPEDALTAEEEIKDPYVLEFLGLKDEYSETECEEALIRHLESFLLELGSDFAFVARQKRIAIGDAWYRMDLLLFHRRLRCLVIVDLKVGEFTHADAGQMNLYVNYAAEHLTLPGENPPVGLILCSKRDAAVAHYALGNLVNKVMAAEYRMALPDPARLEEEIEKTRRTLRLRAKEVRTPEAGEKAA